MLIISPTHPVLPHQNKQKKHLSREHVYICPETALNKQNYSDTTPIGQRIDYTKVDG